MFANSECRLWTHAARTLLCAWMGGGLLGAQSPVQKPQTVTAAVLLLPSAVAYDAAGDLFFADARRNQVFELSLAGSWSVVAGTGEQGFAGDGGPATAALLNAPRGLAFGADGTLYIADTSNARVRAVKAGVISTFAGSGVSGYSEGAAGSARFSEPTGMAIDASGALLLCDTGNHRVRRVSNGQVTTLAGSGTQGFSGDGAAATAAELDSPMGVATAGDGSVLIADTHNHRLRRVRTDGTITTFAGNGVATYSGDGGPALQASFDLPYGVASANDGSVLIADAGNQRIRRVAASGNVSTAVGSGVQGTAADGIAGAMADVDSPRAVALNMFAQPVIADSGNGLVRELAIDNALYTLAILSSPRVTQLTVSLPVNSYGATELAIQVSGVAIPQGTVTLAESGSVLASAGLASGSATVSLAQLTAGPHILSVAYSGDGLNGAASSSAVPVSIAQAASATTLTPISGTYTGLSMPLSATVASAAGRPTGSVDFLDGSSTVASGVLVNGVASVSIPAPAQGPHSFVAHYRGDLNFIASSSAAVSATVTAMPDFTVSTTSAAQSVQGGSVAVFPLSVSPVNGAFTGVVSLSVAGLPPGATASFSPPSGVPGASALPATLTVQTVARAAMLHTVSWTPAAADVSLFTLLLVGAGARRRRLAFRCLAFTCLWFVMAGCGTRTTPTAASNGGQTYTLTITGTGTNLAGSSVTHATAVSLTVF